MIENLINHKLFKYIIIGWLITILHILMIKRELKIKKTVDMYTVYPLFFFGLLTIFFTLYLIIEILF